MTDRANRELLRALDEATTEPGVDRQRLELWALWWLYRYPSSWAHPERPRVTAFRTPGYRAGFDAIAASRHLPDEIRAVDLAEAVPDFARALSALSSSEMTMKRADVFRALGGG